MTAARLRQAAGVVRGAVARLDAGKIGEARRGLERLSAALDDWARDAVLDQLERLTADDDEERAIDIADGLLLDELDDEEARRLLDELGDVP